MKWYVCDTIWTKIQEVEVEKETLHFLIIKGRRERKKSTWRCYFKTMGECKNWLVENAEYSVKSAIKRLKKAQERLQEVKSIDI